MIEANVWTCHGLLARLKRQIDLVLPEPQSGYTPAEIPLERLPVIADLVRTYVETSAIVAQLQQPETQEQQTE